MRKLLSAALAAAICISILSGCGSQVIEAGSWDDSDDASAEVLSASSGGAEIVLSDSGISIDGTGAYASGSTLTINAAGVYDVTGTLSDGQIIIAADDDDKVELNLNGASVYCSHSAAIYAKTADKLILDTAEGTKNYLGSTGEFVQTDDNNVDAALFAKCDLTLKGDGALIINCEQGHGIVTKDDLKVSGGSYDITAAAKGVCGKDSVTINGGAFVIVAGDDGISSNNSEDAEKGNVTINDGSLTVTAGDDGIHADSALSILGGAINIVDSYEGLEGLTVDIFGGTIDIKATDYGINAAGGADSSNALGPFGGDSFNDASGAYVTISGGAITVDAAGDGIDSNGSLTVSGGCTYVSGPTDSANGALDYAGSGAVTGGIFIATGASGMAMSFGSSSTQGVILYCFDSVQSGGVSFSVSDESGNELAEFVPVKDYRCVVVSSPELVSGGSYTLAASSGHESITMDSLIYSNGVGIGGMQNGGMGMQNGMGMQGNMGGGMGGKQNGMRG